MFDKREESGVGDDVCGFVDPVKPEVMMINNQAIRIRGCAVLFVIRDFRF